MSIARPFRSLALCLAGLTAIATATTLTACRGSTGPTEPAVEAPVAKPVADARSAMRGVWTVDVDRLSEQASFREMPEDQRTLALEMASNLLTSMTVTFTEKDYSVTTGGKTVAGTYVIASDADGRLELTLTEAGAEASETMVVTVDSRGLIMLDDGDALPLRRRPGADEGDAPKAE